MIKSPVFYLEPFAVPPSVRQSFARPPMFFRIQSPLRLVRLVQLSKWSREGVWVPGSRIDGLFWFEERVFNQLRRQALADLRHQETQNGRPFQKTVNPLSQLTGRGPTNVGQSIDELVGNYVAQCLRMDLAICKDWTTDFDAYITLVLWPGDTLTALCGPIKNQPYYETPRPGAPAAKVERHQRAESAGVSLIARADQYVIDFRYPGNQSLQARIQPPRSMRVL